MTQNIFEFQTHFWLLFKLHSLCTFIAYNCCVQCSRHSCFLNIPLLSTAYKKRISKKQIFLSRDSVTCFPDIFVCCTTTNEVPLALKEFSITDNWGNWDNRGKEVFHKNIDLIQPGFMDQIHPQYTPKSFDHNTSQKNLCLASGPFIWPSHVSWLLIC